jgi:hypothetical protein
VEVRKPVGAVEHGPYSEEITQNNEKYQHERASEEKIDLFSAKKQNNMKTIDVRIESQSSI